LRFQQCIRRANLDASAGKAETTIALHVRGVKRAVGLSSVLRKPPSVSQTLRGPMPVDDTVGMSLAIEMLMYSISVE
jgi:hypothetical protein